MNDLGAVLDWLKYRRRRKEERLAAKAHEELFYKTVTIHGRQELAEMMRNEEEIPSYVRRMYWVLLDSAPIREWSIWN